MQKKAPRAKLKEETKPLEDAVLERIAGMFATFDDLEVLSDRMDRLEAAISGKGKANFGYHKGKKWDEPTT